MLKSLSGGGCPNKFTSSHYNYENDPEQEIYVSNPDQFPENNINDGDDNNYNEDEQLHENVNPYTYTYTYPSKQNFNTSSNSVSDSRPQYSRRLDPHLNTGLNEEDIIQNEEDNIPNEEYFEEYFKELMQKDISNQKPNNKEFIYKHIDEINFNKSDLYLIMDYGKITGTDNIGNKLKKKLTSKYQQIK
jgi:hypothetical protein